MKKLLLILTVFISIIGFSQKKKFQINGAARGYILANELDISQDLDTVTTKKSNYGHTLLDLGVSAYPNDKTEVLGMFRIKNELGGFWGGGTSFEVRQLTVKGVAGDLVKYQLGDIDLKMTPYTLFNTLEEGVINEADAFALRREIVHYDMFYTKDNTWRMQGGQAQFGLDFAKYLKSVHFNTFITRQRVTDGIATPERLFGGGTVTINQSDDLKIKLNNINLFDLSETTIDSAQFSNSVFSGQIDYNYKLNDDVKIGFTTELGKSITSYKLYSDTNAPEKFDDTFLDVALTATLSKLKTKISLGFKDVGPDFKAPGSQSRRVNYFSSPGVYGKIGNGFISRQANYFDVVSRNAETLYKISENLQNYNIAYSNANPYGVATPNRRGVYLNATRTDTSGIRESFIQISMLNEIRGSGTFQKKSFLTAKAGTDIYINDFIDWEKIVKLDLGFGYESTSRGGEDYEKIALTNMLIDAGLTFEFIENFDLLVGAKMWSFKGNEFSTSRNAYNEVDDFTEIDFDFSENTIAMGLRYRFNESTALSAQYQTFQIDDRSAADFDYGISQFNILYNMFF